VSLKTVRRLLIANRGEIASRIIRTARRLGVETVAVYSDADAGAPFVREADAAVAIGGALARESYLKGETILAAARAEGCDSVHPGYGFLSENAAFAEATRAAGLIFVGPPVEAINAMGLKDAAKALMSAAGVPVTPGYHGQDQSDTRLAAEAERLGYPILIKAVAGGGGKGMRRVEDRDGFAAALAAARREAKNSFGDDKVLLEIYVARPRHIEVQIFADAAGETVHLFERDCSLQRRHQKVIEEAPAPGMTPEAREAITTAAVRAARAVNYVGAGTVEFIADATDGLRPDRIWFMEMNTRLQVEHPVTEAITGVDLVEWQLRIADGQALPLRQAQIRLNGWAMEARLYAETPETGFLPSTGPLTRLRLPFGRPDVRVDSGVEEGGEVTPFYDPMIAKIIAKGPTRREAAETLAAACAGVEVHPVKTNASFLVRCLRDADFLAGEVDTGFIAARGEGLTRPGLPGPAALGAAFRLLAEARGGLEGPFAPLGGALGFRLNASPIRRTTLHLEGEALGLDLPPPPEARSRSAAPAGAGAAIVFEGGRAFRLAEAPAAVRAGAAAPGSDGRLAAPMPGRVVSVTAVVGATVRRGEALAVLEAMKMEHALQAPFDGVVAEVGAAPGDQVEEGALLVRVAAP
jgi:acetyl/propionyl-CoA carboxylase alpha subunit